jgi:hypothetical protein
VAYEQYTNGIPYLAPGSLLSDIPSYTQAVAPKLVNSRGETLSTVSDLVDDHETRLSSQKFVEYHHNFGTLNGDSQMHLTAIRFNGEVGDVWTATFILDCGPPPGHPTGNGGAIVLLVTALGGIPLYHPTSNHSLEIGSLSAPQYATWTWRAPVASDFPEIRFFHNNYGLTNIQLLVRAINHGAI